MPADGRIAPEQDPSVSSGKSKKRVDPSSDLAVTCAGFDLHTAHRFPMPVVGAVLVVLVDVARREERAEARWMVGIIEARRNGRNDG